MQMQKLNVRINVYFMQKRKQLLLLTIHHIKQWPKKKKKQVKKDLGSIASVSKMIMKKFGSTILKSFW